MSGLAVLMLAAGRSRRFGSADKLMAPLDGRAVLDWAIAAQAGLTAGRFAVARSGAAADRLSANGFAVTLNDDPAAGQGRSLALGAAAVMVSDADRMLVLLGDMPRVTSSLLDRLVAAGPFAATIADGRAGPPALFPRRLFGALSELDGDRGAQRWLADAVRVPAREGELGDVDTVADLQALSTSSGTAK